MPDYTSIRVTEELADELHDRKDRGDSYEDVIWRLMDSEDSREKRYEEPDSEDATPGVDTGETTFHTPEENEDPDGLDDVEFPSTLDRDACLTAAHTAINLIADRGGATKAEIVQEVMPAHSLGYDPDEAIGKIEAGERYRGAWWRRVIKPALEASPDVEKPKPGASEWKYVGGE